MTHKNFRRPAGPLGAALLALTALVFAPPDAAAQGRPARGAQGGGERLAPPAGLNCPRDNTTSFSGAVLSYSRGAGRIRLRVRTDEETTEQFTLAYGKGDPRRFFLLRGERFAAADWRKIETRAGRLRPGTRVVVWACYEGNNPSPRLLDWRPREN